MRSKQHATQQSGSRFLHYFARHRYAGLASFSHLLRTPLSTFLTIMVIAVALALPASLIVMLQNVQVMSSAWDMGSRISLFLNPSLTNQQALAVVGQLRQDPRIEQVTYISPEQGLQEFEQRSGFSNMLKELPNNPLPGVIEVEPRVAQQTPANLSALIVSLKTIPNVDTVQADMAWVKRLFGILNLGKQAIYALGILLALAVLLIIGNTIRLIIQNRHHEIEVMKLVGGTDSFIRRPFLHAGMLYGLCGGLLAWLLTDLFLWTLRGPVHHLATLYASQFELVGLTQHNVIILLVISTLLGLGGAFFAVGRQLQKITPS
ncbi:MAG: permease-like cell division protein FtsX [Legionellales bacterium]|nr:permease-like cell division protein FtsX [Legionellales bacterium]